MPLIVSLPMITPVTPTIESHCMDVLLRFDRPLGRHSLSRNSPCAAPPSTEIVSPFAPIAQNGLLSGMFNVSDSPGSANPSDGGHESFEVVTAPKVRFGMSKASVTEVAELYLALKPIPRAANPAQMSSSS